MPIFIKFKEPKGRLKKLAKKLVEFDGSQFEIAYELLNSHQTKSIVFLHGWGSNKELMMQAFSQCFLDFNHLYIDLPGFGRSYNENVLDTNQYAQIIQKFLNILGLEVQMIVGHSFGGKIATLLMPKELVLLSTAGIVCPKSFFVRSKIILAKLSKKIGISFKGLRSKDANHLNDGMYETFKKVVDEDFSPHFSTCSSKAYIFWGKQDRATPLSSGELIHSLIKESFFAPFDGDHYFFLHYPREIEKQILRWRGERG